MLYPARWKKITVDQSKVLKNRLFRFFGATRYSMKNIPNQPCMRISKMIIVYISDLLNPPHPGSKLFEELVLDFNISPRDRRKFNFLMKNIPGDWLLKVDFDHEIVFDRIKSKVVNTQKVPKFAYSIMLEPHNPGRKDLTILEWLCWP